MLKSMYFLMIFFILTGANIQFACAQYAEDFRSKAVLEKQYTDIKGSPYLNDEWSAGIVKMASGSTYKDMSVKFDQISGELVFKSKDGKPLGFADPVAEFKLTDKNGKNRLFRNGYKTADANSDKTFYEVLYDGGTILLKDPKKNIVEHRSYNSSTVVKSIVETPGYFLQVNGQLIKIKKDKKAILNALGNPTQLEKYIQDNKLNIKEDVDLVKLIAYYDSVKT